MRVPRSVVKNMSKFQAFRALCIARSGPAVSDGCPLYLITSQRRSLFQQSKSTPSPSFPPHNSSRGFHVYGNIVWNKVNAEAKATKASTSKDQNSKEANDQEKESRLHDKGDESKDSDIDDDKARAGRHHENEQNRINDAYEKDEEQSKKQTAKDRKEEYRKKYTVNTAVITQSFFENLKKKNKETFLASIDVFTMRDKFRRGHVEFIYAALKHMKEFGTHRDLDAYKKLLHVFPKGTMVAQSFWQVEFMHYPKQQICAIDLLEQMEENGVMGDTEVEDILETIFGSKSFPSRKHGRMMYWMPKFKNLSPWFLPDPLPDDCLELVKLAIQRITSVDLQTKITIFNAEDLEDAVDHTWIVSGQSPDQQSLIESHPADQPIYVEGAFRVWLRDQCINYFILRSAPRPPPKEDNKIDPDDVGILHHLFTEDYKEKAVIPLPTVHEQEDGIILACCATATSSRDSVVSWIRFLQESNPRLGKDISIIFTLKSPIGPTDNLDDISIASEEAKKEALEKEKDIGLIGTGLGFDPIRPELDQVGIERLSDTRFVNWPHHFNRKAQVYEDEFERVGDDGSSQEKDGRQKVEGSQNSKEESKKLS